MIKPTKLRHGGLLAFLLVIAKFSIIVVNARNSNSIKIMPLASRGSAATAMAKSKSSALSDLVSTSTATTATNLVVPMPARDTITDVVANNNTIPRGGGDGERGLKARLKVGFYFALWYTLNIIYNSELIINNGIIF